MGVLRRSPGLTPDSPHLLCTGSRAGARQVRHLPNERSRVTATYCSMRRRQAISLRRYASVTETLTTGTTWSAPYNLLKGSLYVEAEAGAGSGGRPVVLGVGGGGGGGGAYAAAFDPSVGPNDTPPYTIGQGGTAPASGGPVDGNPGTNTTWNTNVVIAAAGAGGGGTGIAGAGGTTAASTGTTKVAGTNGNANNVGSGGDGGSGATGGTITGGTGGLGGSASNTDGGDPGVAPGGGGGGGRNLGPGQSAGNGAIGVIKLTYTVVL